MSYEFISGILCFLSSTVLHLLLLRVMGTGRFLIRALVFAGLISLFLGISLGIHSSPQRGLIAVATYLLLWNYYLFFVVNMTNSFSLRMCAELYVSPDQTLTQRQILDRVPSATSLRARLDAMEQAGILRKRADENYELLPHGRRIGRILSMMRFLFAPQITG